MMGAIPEAGTPDDETHIVHATAVLRDVQYHGNAAAGGVELVSYDASDAVSTEKILVEADAVRGGIIVLLDGVPLERVGSALEVSAAVESAGYTNERARGGAAWSLDDATGVVTVARTAGGWVAILHQAEQAGLPPSVR
jgi:hypothetical protein